MARKDIAPEKKPKPLTKKERKERKRKRKEKHVYEWLFFNIFSKLIQCFFAQNPIYTNLFMKLIIYPTS